MYAWVVKWTKLLCSLYIITSLKSSLRRWREGQSSSLSIDSTLDVHVSWLNGFFSFLKFHSDFLTGFQKRKKARKKIAQQEAEEKMKEGRRQERQKRRDALEEELKNIRLPGKCNVTKSWRWEKITSRSVEASRVVTQVATPIQSRQMYFTVVKIILVLTIICHMKISPFLLWKRKRTSV